MKRLTLLSTRLVRWIRPWASLAAAVALTASVAHAQADKAAEFFGRGVHAYYAGDFEDAVELLDQSVAAAGDTDPRPYYFRGLAHHRMGHTDLAEADFEAGAAIEASDVIYPKMVNFSLQRVQGNLRVTLEKYRTAGKAQKRDRVAEERAARHAELLRLERDVVQAARSGRGPTYRYNRDYEEDPGALVAPAAPEGPGEAEAVVAPRTPAPTEEMPDEPAPVKPAAPEEMPAEDAPKAPPKPVLESEDPADMPAKTPAPETPAEEAPAAAKAPGRLGRLFGVFAKPITDAAGSTGKAAAGAVPGAGGPPDGAVPPPSDF